MTDKIHEFTAPDGSFGYSLSEEMMLSLMSPLISSIDKDEFTNDENLLPITEAVVLCLGEEKAETLTGDELMGCVIAKIIYKLSIDEIITELGKGNIVKYCFDKYNKENNVFGPDNLKDMGADNTVKISPNISISHNLKSDADKFMAMLPMFNEVVKSASPEIMRKVLYKGYPYLVGEPNQEQMTNATAGVCLILRYKKNIHEVESLIKNKTVMDVCFNEFIKEKGTGMVSEMIGVPPTSSIN